MLSLFLISCVKNRMEQRSSSRIFNVDFHHKSLAQDGKKKEAKKVMKMAVHRPDDRSSKYL